MPKWGAFLNVQPSNMLIKPSLKCLICYNEEEVVLPGAAMMNRTACLCPWYDSWANAVEQYGMETSSEAGDR